MLITRKSLFSGKTQTMDLPVTQEQLDRFEAGALVQDVFPQLTPTEREFLITGVTPEEWDAEFAEDEDHDF